MSEQLKHECGIALIRLKKPLAYYEQKYGTPLYGFNQLFLLMEKQHNRGQDGAGIGTVKLGMPPGKAYMFRQRDTAQNALTKMFARQLKDYQQMVKKGIIHPEFPQTVKDNFDFGGEILLGHLRYGTYGNYDKGSCHPYFRKSTWPTRNLMLAGNFNFTNTEELNQQLIDRGSHPIFATDTQTALEEIGFHLDEAHNHIYREMRDKGVPGRDIPDIISEKMDIVKIVSNASKDWDGGFTIAGLIGNGDCFVMRDKHGIRPGFYYDSDEVVAVASERVAIQTIFGVPQEEVRAIKPSHVLVIRHNAEVSEHRYCEDAQSTECSFERIYFSRGNDADIYRERKALGAALAPQVMRAIDNDLEHAVLGFIPNTAELSYYGLLEALRRQRRREVKDGIMRAYKDGTLSEELVDDLILRNWPRGEKVAHKDIKLRTFISQEKNRLQLASHVYDVTYGVVEPGVDALVCVDDSIVRGTTLKQSILRILARTQPRKIVIASTAPQIRYPDCYGIDMSEFGKLISFQATMALIRERGMNDLLREVYEDCLRQLTLPMDKMVNHVKRVYEQFSAQEITEKVTEMTRPTTDYWSGEYEVIFQSIEDLHKAIPHHSGDWYFTGNFPTPGGMRVVNRAFIQYYENRQGRGY